MKRILLIALAAATTLQARAELFSPESFTGAAIGAVAGGVIGHNNGRHGGEGAAIGAGVGFLAGSLIHNDRERHGYYSSGYYSSPFRSHISVGFSSPYYNGGHHHYYRPHYGLGFSYGYDYYRPVYVRPTYVAPVVTTPVYVQQPAPVAQSPAPTQTAAPVTIINNYYNTGPSTPMSSANAMFGR